MTGLSTSPRLIKGGLVLVHPQTGAVQRVIPLQYNPETLTRTLQAQAQGDGGERSEALRIKGPPVETIRLEAELDATDQLEFPDQNRDAAQLGIHPQLAALEALLYPSSEQLAANHLLASVGTLEIVPMEALLALFVWSRNRIVPVRITDFSVVEEAFDPSLNPVRAKVTLGLRVLSVDDLGFSHKGGNLFLGYLRSKEALAQKAPAAGLSALGLGGIP